MPLRSTQIKRKDKKMKKIQTEKKSGIGERARKYNTEKISILYQLLDNDSEISQISVDSRARGVPNTTVQEIKKMKKEFSGNFENLHKEMKEFSEHFGKLHQEMQKTRKVLEFLVNHIMRSGPHIEMIKYIRKLSLYFSKSGIFIPQQWLHSPKTLTKILNFQNSWSFYFIFCTYCQFHFQALNCCTDKLKNEVSEVSVGKIVMLAMLVEYLLEGVKLLNDLLSWAQDRCQISAGFLKVLALFQPFREGYHPYFIFSLPSIGHILQP